MKSVKNGKIGKKAFIMAVLLVALGAAVWLNMSYSSNSAGFLKSSSVSTKNLGETEYVDNQSNVGTAAASANEADYFTKTKVEREKTRTSAIDLLKETVNNPSATKDAKTEASKRIDELAKRMENEASIESLIKAKGFENAVVIISDKNVNVVVSADELLESQTLQIQDAVKSSCDISLENIKIVNIK